MWGMPILQGGAPPPETNDAVISGLEDPAERIRYAMEMLNEMYPEPDLPPPMPEELQGPRKLWKEILTPGAFRPLMRARREARQAPYIQAAEDYEEAMKERGRMLRNAFPTVLREVTPEDEEYSERVRNLQWLEDQPFFRNPIKYGYFGSTPYSYAIFAPDLEHIAIWFDMTAPAGGFTEPANANLQLHMRSKPDPNYPDGAVGPTTDNIVARYDFLPCLSGGSPVPLNTDPAVMSADCRRVVRTDELGNTFEAVEVTYVVNSDLARLYEFRVEASGDFTPETARSDDTRAMTLIDKPEASFSCPLKDGTTGVSTDPKWVTPAG